MEYYWREFGKIGVSIHRSVLRKDSIYIYVRSGNISTGTWCIKVTALRTRWESSAFLRGTRYDAKKILIYSTECSTFHVFWMVPLDLIVLEVFVKARTEMKPRLSLLLFYFFYFLRSFVCIMILHLTHGEDRGRGREGIQENCIPIHQNLHQNCWNWVSHDLLRNIQFGHHRTHILMPALIARRWICLLAYIEIWRQYSYINTYA